jgi:hypothetical protein
MTGRRSGSQDYTLGRQVEVCGLLNGARRKNVAASGLSGFQTSFALSDPVKVKQVLIVCFWILTLLWFGFEAWARLSDVADDHRWVSTL